MRELAINVTPGETRIAIIENGRLAELQIERQEDPSQVGNIYLGRVDSVVPGMQSAFIDYGDDKNGFLYVSDIAGAEGTGDVVLEDGIPRAKTRAGRARQQPIETMLKKGQHVMVQVVKDRLGTKGARLTNFITIPGRYMVLMPTVATLGVSRKIESHAERDRLRKVLQQIRIKGVGLITRTAGEGRWNLLPLQVPSSPPGSCRPPRAAPDAVSPQGDSPSERAGVDEKGLRESSYCAICLAHAECAVAPALGQGLRLGFRLVPD